jgi:putative ATP-binding cassette transporter
MVFVPRRAFLTALWSLIKPYWVSERRAKGLTLLAATVALSLGIVYVNVRFAAWNNDFYNAIQEKQLATFYRLLGVFTGLAAAYIIMGVYRLYLTQMLQIEWRSWLTERYLSSWLGDRAYYRLQLLDHGTDNPDQRIAEDLKLFVDSTLTLGLGLLSAVVTLVSFVAMLWVISGPLTVPLGAGSLTIPGYMVWFAVVYAMVGSWLTHTIGHPLIGLQFAQQRVEADFRFSLVRVRENSEGVALYRGEAGELTGFRERFAHVIGNWWSIMKKQKQLTWFTTGYAQIAIIFPFLVAAPRYFSGAIALGGLMQIAVAFGQVQTALSWFIEAYTQFAAWRATVDRLTGFTAAIDAVHRPDATPAGQRIEGADDALTIEALSLMLPDGRPLATDTTLRFARGEHVLVRGPSGTGKSTLFRALAGIWPYWKGRIALPKGARLLFLPQKTYLPLGTLKAAIAYPLPAAQVDDDSVREALTAVGLPQLVGDLARVDNWSQVLSGGEQQRVAFARALINKPDWLFLDEATASLPDTDLYDVLHRRLAGTTLVSVGHQEALARHHARQFSWPPSRA